MTPAVATSSDASAVTPLSVLVKQAAPALLVLGHPLRTCIIEATAEAETASPRVLADALGHPLGDVSYHVRTLAGAGLLREAGTTPRRGAVEHFYAVERNRLRRALGALAGAADQLRVAVDG